MQTIPGIPPRSSPGFTLMEMTVVMFVMAVILGISAYSFSGLSEDEHLRRPALEFQRMTQEAVRRAALHEQPQTILFEPRGFLMRYREMAGASATQTNSQHWQRRVEVPEGMKVALRRWGDSDFKPAAGQKLVIVPGGLCEPLTIRFEQGGSWMEMSLDPLSGGARDESMHVAGAP